MHHRKLEKQSISIIFRNQVTDPPSLAERRGTLHQKKIHLEPCAAAPSLIASKSCLLSPRIATVIAAFPPSSLDVRDGHNLYFITSRSNMSLFCIALIV